jgi:ribonucleoside-diphosphate reductase alpha chain
MSKKEEVQKYTLSYFDNDELASSVFLNKYSLNKEENPKKMHIRLAKEFARIDKKYTENFPDELKTLSPYGCNRFLTSMFCDTKELSSYIFSKFKHFNFIIPGGSVMQGLGSDNNTSLSNCFVLESPDDSIESIFNTARDAAQIYKRRGGVGIDISKLRPNGAKVNNSASSSTGAVSFMHLYSEVTKIICQEGRRGALMLSIDVNHPDVFEFASIKKDLTKITGANISIRLNNEFLKAVKEDKDYILRYPCNTDISIPQEFNIVDFTELEYNKLYSSNSGKFIKVIKAKELWNTIVSNAHLTAEPGIFNWDKLINYDPTGVYEELKPISTNPCGELGLSGYDSCRLIATNLYSLVKDPFTKDSKLDENLAYEVFYEAQMLADNLVDLEIEAVEKILAKISPTYAEKHDVNWNYEEESEEFKLWWKIKEIGEKGRRTGTGITAYADMLAALNLPYGDPEMTERIFQIKFIAELNASVDMAIVRGPFKLWNNTLEYYENKENVYHYKYLVDSKDLIKSLENLRKDSNDTEVPIVGKNEWYTKLYEICPYVAERMHKYGRRNAGISTIAPTGSISILTQTSSGIEPVFMPVYKRKVTCQGDEKPDVIELGIGYRIIPVIHPKLKEWYKINKEFLVDNNTPIEDLTYEDWLMLYNKSPYKGQSSADIDYNKRVDTQSLIQKYITSSISSTVNLPKNTTVKTVSDLYMKAFEKGCKGITVYRDGSRGGILVTEESSNNFKQYDAPKRSKELESELHLAKIEGKCYCIVVGLLENKPYEVFVVKVDPETYSKYQKDLITFNIKSVPGFTIKRSKGHYSFSSPIINIDKLVEGDNVTEKLCTLYTSMLLRQGASIHYVIKTAKKIDSNINSFVTVMCRVLNTYNDKKETLVCDKCGGTVIKEAGCSKCLDCGDSACG